MLRVLLSLVLSVSLWLLGTPLAQAMVGWPPATLPGLQGAFTGNPPEMLGVKAGRLSPCPPSPNCVVSQGTDPEHYIAPIRYQSDLETARAALLKVLTVVPGTVVVEQADDYIRTESTSKLMGFVDDGEFYFPPEQKMIDLRSAARLGESDLGVNRRRLEQIRLALADLGI